MSSITLHPYLFFAGTCKEALEYYQNVFGGDLTISTYGEAGLASSPEMENRVMHAYLSGGAITLMASDSDRDGFGVSYVSLSLNGSDETALRDIFDKLAAEGTQVIPIKKEDWGDLFGSLTDKFGVDWMVNVSGQ